MFVGEDRSTMEQVAEGEGVEGSGSASQVCTAPGATGGAGILAEMMSGSAGRP